MASSQYTLFVGDLSIFCTENDMREVFEDFGELAEVKIIRCEETKKNLSYGFVKYVDSTAAVKAIDQLNGTMLCGRPLRIGWASRKARSDNAMFPPFSQTMERSSVHVIYSSYQIDKLVTEEYFVSIFSKYGTVIDAAVKRFEINEDQRCQKGYGFVHFAYTPEGVAAAIKCCDEMHNHTLDKVLYKCSISHRLRQCMNGGAAEDSSQEMYHVSDYAYPQMMMVNPLSQMGSYPVQYGYNAAGMLVPYAMPMEAYQYANPFVPQALGQQYSQHGQAHTGLPMMPYQQYQPQPFSSSYAPAMTMGYPTAQFYNNTDQSPTTAYSMPYTWGYSYAAAAQQENQSPSDNSEQQYQGTIPSDEQNMAPAQTRNDHACNHQNTSGAPSGPEEGPYGPEVHAAAAAQARFGQHQRLTASAMAAAVHGETPLNYNPQSIAQGYPSYSSNSGSSPSDVSPTGFAAFNYYGQYGQQGQMYQYYSPNGGSTQQQDAARAKSWADLVKDREQSQAQGGNHSAAIPPTHHNAHGAQGNKSSQAPQVVVHGVTPLVLPKGSSTVSSNQRTPSLRRHSESAANPLQQNQQNPLQQNQQNQQNQQHQQHQQHKQNGGLSRGPGGGGGKANAALQAPSDFRPEPVHAPSITATAAARDAAMMVIGTGPSTGHGILVSSLRPRRDKMTFHTVSLESLVVRPRGPATTPRSSRLTTASIKEIIASRDNAAAGGADTVLSAAKRSPQTTRAATKQESLPTPPANQQRFASAAVVPETASTTSTLSPSAQEDTALDSASMHSPVKGQKHPSSSFSAAKFTAEVNA